METAEIRYNGNAMVIQANDLIRGKQDNFTLLEAKLLKLVISQVAAQSTDLKTYTCRIPELAAFLDLHPSEIYREIETTTASLMTKVITIKDKTKKPKRNGEYNWVKFHWVSFCHYADGILTIRLSDEIKPFVLELDKHFTTYGIDNIISLSTSNAIRLFELLSSYEYLTHSPHNNFPQIQKQENEIVFSIDYLREYFNCEDKYPLNADFFRWVIDPSVLGINKNTDMRVSYRTAKEGRKINYILFKINAWEDNDFKDFVEKQVGKMGLLTDSYYRYLGLNFSAK